MYYKMSKYILMECNRDRAIDKSFDSNLTDQYRNKWSNQVSNSGIVINAGDVLSIEETIINTKGADSDVMEFRGEPNENNIIDNRAVLEASYYICHNGRNTATMPMIHHKTYRGQGTLITPFVIDNDDSNRVQGEGIYKVYSQESYLQMISKRSLGETWVAGRGGGNGGQAYTAQLENPFFSPEVIPQTNRVFRMTTTQRGGGLGATAGASNANSGFIEGDSYTTTSSGNGSGMIIRVDSTITIGSVPNIIETFTITDFGEMFVAVANDIITIPCPTIGGVKQGTDHIFTITSALDQVYQSADIRRFDGAKYYPLNVGFTGLVSRDDTLIDNGTAPFDDSNEYDVRNLDNSPTKRSNNIELEIPKGFSTPSAVGNILTDQLSRPEKLSAVYNRGDFLDLENFDFFHDDNISGFTNTGKPNIIASKVFQPHSANFFNNGKGVPKQASFAGRRSAFYQSIAWKEPERFTSLIPAFRQFKVMREPYIAGNEIQTASGSYVGLNTYGDFGRAGTGEFGCHPTLLTNPLVVGGFIDITRGTPIVSNILYTKTNIEKIAKMKGAEKYMGDLGLPVDTTSANYRNNLCVNLDVGYYDDERSTQGTLTPCNTEGIVMADQRIKFATKAEAVAATFNEVSVGNSNQGFQRDLKNTANDGQQLSNLWVVSRWNDDFIYNRLDPQANFNDAFAELQVGAQYLNTANTDINQVFGAGFTDSNGDFISQEEMNSWAKLYDVAVVPFNVPINPADATQNADIKKFDIPFVAFIVGCDYGADAVFDPIKQFSKTGNNWKADPANFKSSCTFGIDMSFTRNQAVAMYNNQLGINVNTLDARNFLNYVNLGAVNPSISFDTDFSRFSISGLNTPLFIGNGLTTDDTLEFTPSDNPQQQTLMINGSHQIAPSRTKNLGSVPAGSPAGTAVNIIRVGQYGKARQAYNSIIDSQSGISIESISVYDGDDNLIKFSSEDLTSQNDYLYHDTLFDKMGFDLDTLITKFGSSEAFFRNPSIIVPNNTYEIQLRHTLKPMTTGASLNANSGQTFSVNSESAPLFDLGGDTLRQIKPDTEQGEITAKRLASKFDFSYLCVYSSLISEGTDTIYIGGSDNQSRLSCMTYLTRENNESDFFYQGEKGFNFTATKDFVITDITTDIRLPNGERPILNASSTIIYKIEKPIRSLPSNTNPISQHTISHGKEK